MVRLSNPAFCIALFVGFSPIAAAETYYVSPGGSDQNDGSQGATFLTLQRAAGVAAAGDVVLVANGDYAGFRGVRSGTAQQPIIFRATGDRVVIDRPCDGCEPHGIDLRSEAASNDYITLEGLTVRGLPRIGIRISRTTGVVIRGCVVHESGQPGIYGGHTTDAVIEDNDIFDNNNHGVYIANSSTRPLIRANRIHGNDVAGIHFNGDVRFPPGDGVIRGARIERNHIYGNGQNGINWDGVQDSLVANNFIYDNRSNGLRAFGPPNSASDSAEGPRNNTLVNNTIRTTGGWAIRITDDLGGHTLFNNILESTGGGGSIAFDNSMGFAAGYNIVDDRLSLDRGNTILSLDEWRAEGHGNGSSVLSGALFVDAADLHLVEGASAVDRGASSFEGRDAPSNDVDGDPRPGGAAIDIGADERRVARPVVDGGVVPPADAGGSVDAGDRPGLDAGAEDLHPDDAGHPNVTPEAPSPTGPSDTNADDVGCGCSTDRRRRRTPALVVAVVLGALLVRRRR